MNRKQVIAATVIGVVATGAIAFAFLRSPDASSAGASREAPVAVDPKLTAVNAAFYAPEGKTPCETGYNALRAVDDQLQNSGRSKPWASFPDRETFLARCALLSEQEQLCLQPKYAAKNHDKCDAMSDRQPSLVDKVMKPSGDAPHDASRE